MAQKRVLRTPNRPAEQEEEEEESWGDWAKRSYAKAWYIVACIFIGSFLLLEVAMRNAFGDLGLGLIALVLLIMAEVFIYIKLWGPNGRWIKPDQ